MPYTRRILHYSPGPADLVGEISDRAVAGCWFELHRQGGCGAGELKLKDAFPERDAIAVGDWIAFEYAPGDRWYQGRVESKQSRSPIGVTLTLEGAGIALGEVFPGGFGPDVGDRVPPHRYAATDMFPFDPDYSIETVDAVYEPHELVSLLIEQYVAPRTEILHDPALIEPAVPPTTVTSHKFRGEESVRTIVKELAIVARNAAWGVREDGKFFFLRPRAEVIATFQEGVDLLSLEETRERDLLYNRVLLTGGYVYEAPQSGFDTRGFYRWRGNYIQPESRDEYGERRIRLWVPWIRTANDSREFTREFFRVYAQPAARYLIETSVQSALLRPWLGMVRLLDRGGAELTTAAVETVRVEFDHAPRFRMELGPEDPHVHWPEPPHDERWEIAGQPNDNGGDEVSLTSFDSTLMSSDDFSSGDTSATSETSGLDSSDDTDTGATSDDGGGSSSDSSSGSESASSGSETSEESDSGDDSGGGSDGSGGGSDGSEGESDSGSDGSGESDSGGDSDESSGGGSESSMPDSSSSAGDACLFLYINGDGTFTGSWDPVGAGFKYQCIDDQQTESDPIDNQATYIISDTDDEHAEMGRFALTNTPADFGEVTSLKVHLRAKGFDPLGRGDALQIFTTLVAADESTAYASLTDGPTFTGDATQNSGAGWTDYVIELSPTTTINKTMLDAAKLLLGCRNVDDEEEETTRVQITAAKVQVCYTTA